MNDLFSSKFVITIKTWKEDELKLFEVWLKSPWCNTNKNLIRLFDKIRKYYPTFKHSKLTKEKLFEQILPDGKFSARRMNNLLSEGYLSAERFLIFQNLAQNQDLQKDLLTKEFQQRNLEDWFFRDANKIIKSLEEKVVKDWEDHLSLLQLHRRIYHHPNQNPRMQPGGATIVKMGEQTDLIYLLEKAAIINEKIFRNWILKNENHDITAELQKWRLISEGIKHPAIDFYHMRFGYTEENRLPQYLELREAFFNKYEHLNEKEQKIHFVSLLNDTTFLIRHGLLDFTETLPLYKLGLKTQFILSQGKLTLITYCTIVSTSNAKKDFDFTMQFLHDYTQKLDPRFQKDAINWAQAHTSYRQQQYAQCLDILLAYEFKIHHFQLITRILTTQVYFDLFLEDDSYQYYLFNYFDSFEKWLLREKFGSTLVKKSYLRFVQISRILAKNYTDVNFQAAKIEHLMETESNIQAPKWLGQKVKQISVLKQRGRPN